MQAMQFSTKTDSLVGIASQLLTTELMVFTSDERMVRVPIDHIPVRNRADEGDRIFKLTKKEELVGAVVVSLPDLNNEAEEHDADLAENGG